jgi:Cu-Zn family superoxide dismutase
MTKTILWLSVWLLAACKSVPNVESQAGTFSEKEVIQGELFASAQLDAKSGSEASGKAWFTKTAKGVQIAVSISNVTPGPHGIHVHEKGDCSSLDASSAGGHYNPTHLAHGPSDPKRFHAGDLGNIIIGEDGTGVLNLAIPATRFHAKFPDWSQLIGKSIVLHAKTDDLVSQPAGDSGDRIACGIIIKE